MKLAINKRPKIGDRVQTIKRGIVVTGLVTAVLDVSGVAYLEIDGYLPMQPLYDDQGMYAYRCVATHKAIKASDAVVVLDGDVTIGADPAVKD